MKWKKAYGMDDSSWGLFFKPSLMFSCNIAFIFYNDKILPERDSSLFRMKPSILFRTHGIRHVANIKYFKL